MTVEEYIRNTKAPYIKLGAKDGNSFIYCGTPKDFIEFAADFTENEPIRLEENFKKLTHELKRFPAAYKRLMKRNYLAFKKDKIYPPKEIDKKSDISKYKNAQEYVHYLVLTREMDHKKLVVRFNRAEKALKVYKPIMEREIVETYPSILTNKYGYKDEIVVMTGLEIGKYWDLDEYENGGEL